MEDCIVEMMDVRELSLVEAAKAIGISPVTLKKELDEGKVKAIWHGKQPKFPVWYIKEWQSENLNAVVSEKVESVLSSKKFNGKGLRVINSH
jgi:lysophospholipid acyltransferase (LPLAT)-like uncharacterized protein